VLIPETNQSWKHQKERESPEPETLPKPQMKEMSSALKIKKEMTTALTTS
jgi:hypothetical protein